MNHCCMDEGVEHISRSTENLRSYPRTFGMHSGLLLASPQLKSRLEVGFLLSAKAHRENQFPRGS